MIDCACLLHCLTESCRRVVDGAEGEPYFRHNMFRLGGISCNGAWSGVEWMEKVSVGAFDTVWGRTYLVRNDGCEDVEVRLSLNVFIIFV